MSVTPLRREPAATEPAPNCFGGAAAAQMERMLADQAVPIHDVGKIGVPDAVLKKPG